MRERMGKNYCQLCNARLCFEPASHLNLSCTLASQIGKTMTHNFHFLIIDPQNDFCDLPPGYRSVDAATGAAQAPALPVPGAHADMQRLSDLIREGRKGIGGISVTLDSHRRLDIAHPTFWTRAEGQAVEPFTQIAASDVRNGVFAPKDPAALPRVLSYLDALESAGRYQLMVWPVHCEIGSWGHNVHADIRAAYNSWEDATGHSVNMVIKGTNPWTEHYSAVMAEVPDPDDPGTSANHRLIDLLAQTDRVFIGGEAGSHCVRATTEHIVEFFKPEQVSKLVLLTDCMSPVVGFDAAYHAFVANMTERGVQTARAAEVLPELLANGRD
jgi:nicotinamidase/pyrazinamidase